jgi:hypothetical protein
MMIDNSVTFRSFMKGRLFWKVNSAEDALNPFLLHLQQKIFAGIAVITGEVKRT